MTSREGRQTGTCRSCDRYIFQLTTSRGGRRFWYISNGYGICFSTHDLSWRSTFYWKKEMYRQIFSTHDLSWRSTYLEDHTYSPKIFQLTTSRGGRQISPAITIWTSFFNSRPLVEVDADLPGESRQGSFSTHDLSWRSTRCRWICATA